MRPQAKENYLKGTNVVFTKQTKRVNSELGGNLSITGATRIPPFREEKDSVWTLSFILFLLEKSLLLPQSSFGLGPWVLKVTFLLIMESLI